MLILEVLMQEYEKNGGNQIRRHKLKELCDDMLNEKTEGRMEAYGGSFQRVLNALEEKMAIKYEKKGPKMTLIIFDIPRIKSLLLDKRFGRLLYNDNMKLTEQEIEPTIWEKIVEQEIGIILNERVKEIYRRYKLHPDFNDDLIQRSYLSIKETITKITSFIAASLYDFIISHQNKDFQLDEDIIIDLGKIARKIASKNLSARFKLVIEYKGVQGSGEELGLVLGPSYFKTILPKCFAQWADNVFNYKVSEEDVKKLSEVKIHLLSPTAKEYYHIFYTSLKDYLNIYNIKSQ
jgi:hypothetical protein